MKSFKIAVKAIMNLPLFLRNLLHCTKVYYRREKLRMNKKKRNEGINIY